VRFHAHQFSEHFSAWNYRNRSTARLDDFGIVITHGGRANHNMRIADVFSSMSLSHFDTEFLKMRRHLRLFLVGTRHAKIQVRQNFGNAGHTDAADTDKMNVLETSEHFLRSADI